jgi:hypothetical protein
VQQREAAAANKKHDLAPLDLNAAGMIHLELMARQASALTAASSTNRGGSSNLKRPAPASSTSAPPAKKAGPKSCFRCGQSNCMPDVCTKTTNTAGKPCAARQTGGRNPRTLLTPDGHPFCFNFAYSGSCSRGSACANNHSCSLCNGAHGAGSCAHLA